MVSFDSVKASWDNIDIPEITGYTVYYRQTESEESDNSADVSDSVNSILIENLMINVEYQFQVVAMAELNGEVVVGERSTLDALSILTVTIQPGGIILFYIFIHTVRILFHCKHSKDHVFWSFIAGRSSLMIRAIQWNL